MEPITERLEEQPEPIEDQGPGVYDYRYTPPEPDEVYEIDEEEE